MGLVRIPAWGALQPHTLRRETIRNSMLGFYRLWDSDKPWTDHQERLLLVKSSRALLFRFTGNLTCKPTDSNSFGTSTNNFGYYPIQSLRLHYHFYYGYDSSPYSNCTKLAWSLRNKPEVLYYNTLRSLPRSDVICGDVTGPGSTFQSQFELVTCAVGSIRYYSWSTVRSCCYSKNTTFFFYRERVSNLRPSQLIFGNIDKNANGRGFA
jgi:hypothetical protein